MQGTARRLTVVLNEGIVGGSHRLHRSLSGVLIVY
jgi:hypothetical protein